MEADVERIDHLGIIAGMIINGLGFFETGLAFPIDLCSLTPQFFENKAMSKLLREGILPAHFNRFKLGRALEA